MFDKVLSRLQQSTDREGNVRVKDDDVEILKVLFDKGKQKQYSLEKFLPKISHSTVTGKLERLSEYRFIVKSQGPDGLNYYELTPEGLAILIAKEKVTFERALNYFEENQTQYFEALMRLRPNLIEHLQKRPAWFTSQLSADLWAIYYIADLSEVRSDTLKWILGKTKDLFPRGIDFRMNLYCSNRIDVEGKGICLKERKACLHKESDCPILQQQLEEIAKTI